ncbi:inner membrane sensor for iron transport [Shewanella hanedai]|jgi:transmembrane sensor|uniref:DUF4974 domain-containing protein n=1 Tax=Shewanella hanedai TaxID=25 RepID=A0A553JQM1_SHEHA|nr:FecR domain-containing protein [Shewanella hanedai]TRY14748.1 DUF4974 domain-containing protein [Shewanella hanedai]GGI76468.1 inner membrane sensor for iron transport [Shewanella hanedai]
MSNIHQLNADANAEDLRLDRASEWIAKMDRELTDEERVALATWLHSDVENLKVLFEIAQMWDKMDELGRLSDIFPKTKPARKQSPVWMGAIAASILLFLSVGIYVFTQDIEPNGQPSSLIAIQSSYQTAVGESNTINLPDNSILVLNTNSFVQVRYTAKERIIELQRGEINIEVAHDTSRPLSVLAGGKVIRAVGTAFNVDVRASGVELIVTDGKVLVVKKSAAAFLKESKESRPRVTSSALAVAKDERVMLNNKEPLPRVASKVTPGEIATKLSWRTGNLIFRGESLEEAMAEISRYTDIHFELADDENLKKIKVAGMFKTGDVNGLLNILDQNFNVSHERLSRHNIKLNYGG